MPARENRWRLVITPPRSGAWNMACDEVFGREVLAGESLSVVRFFRWNPPAISFGYGQRIAREVDVEAVRGDGVGLVRRMTGGRAVLHCEEITYSVICPEDDPVAAGGITATYARISTGLAEGLRKLGVNAELARSSEPLAAGAARAATLPCFGSTSRAEVVVGGRKIVGSAQHRMRGLVLQHGSVLLGPAHRNLVRYLRADEEMRGRYMRRLVESTTSLAELGWDGDVGEAIRALAAGLSGRLGLSWVDDSDDGAVGAEEDADIEKLASEKYGADWWNFAPQSSREVTDEPVG